MKKQRFIKTSSCLLLFFLFQFYFFPLNGFAQSNIIKGTIKDEKGEPLAGVTITQKGAGNATTSAGDGSFSIDAPAGSVLVFTYVGYVGQELSVSGSNALS